MLLLLQAAMSVGSDAPISGQAHQLSPPSSLSSLTPAVIPSPAQALKPSVPISSTSLASVLDAPDSAGSTTVSHTANLVKPSYFTPPATSGLVMLPVAAPLPAAAPPLHLPVTLQRPYGTPLLQPFPPPTPSPSLTPPTSYGPVITRDRVRDALSRLVQVIFLSSISTQLGFIRSHPKWPLLPCIIPISYCFRGNSIVGCGSQCGFRISMAIFCRSPRLMAAAATYDGVLI